MLKLVFVTTQFEGFHRWKDAPDNVAFLRDWHRHIFHVKLWMKVEGLNREIEFIQLKHRVEVAINRNYKGKQFEESCEMIAANLLEFFRAAAVEVSEDGENGAIVFAKE